MPKTGEGPNSSRKLELSDLQSEFIDFLLNPSKTKGSMAEWGRTHNVPYPTLIGWKDKNRFFRSEWEARAAELNVAPDRIQDVIEAVWLKAKQGDVKAATLYLQYVDKFTPKSAVVNVEKSIEAMTDEELLEALENLADQRGVMPERPEWRNKPRKGSPTSRREAIAKIVG